MKVNTSFSLFVLMVFILGNSSCKQPKKNDSENWDVKNTRIVDAYDEINSIAIKNAQDSLGLFIKLFNQGKNGDLEFYIKSKFNDGKNIENMWSTLNSMHDDSLFATVNNVPLKLTTIKLNDKVKLAKKDIEDWIIYKGDSVLFGNFIERSHK